ncbi:sensor domain-containing diguanylate cyclase [Pseudoxanthomonas suwonensis]|jgi:diguanylate cyclase (GGDEF) domain|uniref:sensor domain-containing diguanylate cyclase n=1 Tax=Pseudoxanthomonas suwonensis TaxID=314722 RepID=UPI00138EE446|nr:sensor domain-containing diguanylate cyclase [Pseudoxanthomonas suwonensis]KAF1700428.1 diguanylate cyclase [Pseudoxanthomonas suwonensis]
MRAIGFVVAALGIVSSLDGQGAPAWVLALLAVNTVAWPAFAWWRGESTLQPLRTAYRLLLVDTAIAGFWMAMMGFDLLPCAMLLAVMLLDRLIAGGWSLAGRALLTTLAGAVVGWVVAGFPFHPETTFRTMLWCMPFFLLYPLGTGTVAWRLTEQVRMRKRELEQDSRIDPQTGLNTRRQWQAQVVAEVRRYRRHGTVASLMMLDIDHFKQINDAEGHLAGDEVIRRVAACVLDNLRGGDAAGRFGGDEFGVLLPGTAREAALDVARRLAQAVRECVMSAGRPVTLSIGVAEIGPGLDEFESWTGAADAALYRAKLAGRNCVRD